MTAHDFWVRFQKEICGNSELCGLWYDSTAFTERMMEKLENVIREEHCKTEREYFRIDLISYQCKEQYGSALLGSLKNYSWNLVTAVEHENNRRLWVDEVIKLAHIACRLRVVIGYLPVQDDYGHESYLHRVAEELRGIDAWEHTQSCGEFMILIGDCKLEGQETACRCVYTPYVYRDGEFVRPLWA